MGQMRVLTVRRSESQRSVRRRVAEDSTRELDGYLIQTRFLLCFTTTIPLNIKFLMALNSFTQGLSIIHSDEFSGPDDLSNGIISIRGDMKSNGLGDFSAPISDQGIRRLISLAFYASLAPEE